MPSKVNNALTPLAVKNAKPGRYADGGGLYLVVKDSGARSWVYRYMLHGKRRDSGLGPAGADSVTLASARDEATKLRLKIRAGIDPLAEKQQEKAAAKATEQAAKVAGVTFGEVAASYIAANEGNWKNDKHRQQWRNTLATYVYPVIGDLPVASISTAHVLTIIEPMWNAKAETADRVRGRIETVLDAAKARGYREGENPARWRGHLAQILPARARLSRGNHKAMPYEELPAFITKLRSREAVAAMALEFAILTAARTGEVLGARWDEVDMNKAVWTIPAARMKAGKEHKVPLSPRAIELLTKAAGLGSEWLFPSANGGKLSSMAMSMLLRRMGVAVTVHGFRSSFRDWAAECTGYSHEVCEMALAHTIGNKAEAAYRRGDLLEKRRRLAHDWALFLDTPKGEAANVTPIRAEVA
jgi:integrase